MNGRIWLYVSFLPLILVLGVWSCSDDTNTDLPFAPSDCQSSKPATGDLGIDLTINAQNPSVPVEVYSGAIEDGQLVVRDTLEVGQIHYQLSVDHSYSVTARYIVGPDTVLAIAQDDITAHQQEYSGYQFCWEVKNARVDVRLKL